MAAYEGAVILLLGVIVVILGCILWRLDHIQAIQGLPGPPGPQGAAGAAGRSDPFRDVEDNPKTLSDKDIDDYEGY